MSLLSHLNTPSPSSSNLFSPTSYYLTTPNPSIIPIFFPQPIKTTNSLLSPHFFNPPPPTLPIHSPNLTHLPQQTQFYFIFLNPKPPKIFLPPPITITLSPNNIQHLNQNFYPPISHIPPSSSTLHPPFHNPNLPSFNSIQHNPIHLKSPLTSIIKTLPPPNFSPSLSFQHYHQPIKAKAPPNKTPTAIKPTHIPLSQSKKPPTTPTSQKSTRKPRDPKKTQPHTPHLSASLTPVNKREPNNPSQPQTNQRAPQPTYTMLQDTPQHSAKREIS